ncbi:MAG: hypothetical protein GF372_12700 [Candidatus Marinimicrobia bacterium]|nr:hypothetical protein [Candidatus Neomarinimicrobiota bacterium]
MSNEMKRKVVEELDRIPQSKLPEIYDLIHHYRLGLKQGSARKAQILELAGSWKSMTEDQFSLFMQEITDRRSQAFQHRREDESGSS